MHYVDKSDRKSTFGLQNLVRNQALGLYARVNGRRPTIVDGFTFFNELDVLETRLRYLYSTVDRFVIVEAPTTHTGISKPLYFEENRSRFDWAQDKIVHIVEELTVDTPDPWVRENEQRNAIAKGLTDLSADDIVIISDVDEIPNRKVVWRNRFIRTPHILRQLLHYYYFNYRCSNRRRAKWHGAVMAPLGTVSSPQELRDAGIQKQFPVLRNGGWHFSYLGGSDAIKTKIQSFAHSEFDRSDIKSDKNIEAALRDGSDLYGREDHRFEFVPMTRFPKDLRALLLKHSHLVRT